MSLEISDTQKKDVDQMFEYIMKNCIMQGSRSCFNQRFEQGIRSDKAFEDIYRQGYKIIDHVEHVTGYLEEIIRYWEALERLFDMPEIKYMRAKLGYSFSMELIHDGEFQKSRREILSEVIPRLRAIDDMKSLSYCYASLGIAFLYEAYGYNGAWVKYTDALYWLKKAEDITGMSDIIAQVEAKLKEVRNYK